MYNNKQQWTTAQDIDNSKGTFSAKYIMTLPTIQMTFKITFHKGQFNPQEPQLFRVVPLYICIIKRLNCVHFLEKSREFQDTSCARQKKKLLATWKCRFPNSTICTKLSQILGTLTWRKHLNVVSEIKESWISGFIDLPEFCVNKHFRDLRIW